MVRKSIDTVKNPEKPAEVTASKANETKQAKKPVAPRKFAKYKGRK